MRNLFFLLFFSLLTLSTCTSDVIPEPITSAIQSVKEQVAPDKRVALFAITPSMKGGEVVLEGETTLPTAKEQLLSAIKESGLSFQDQITVLPTEDLEGKHFGVVNLSACNIRSKPGDSQELATQSTLGTALKVFKKSGSWYLVQTPDHYLGWLDEGGFAWMNEADFRTWESLEKVVYLPDFGFSLSAPETSARRVSDLLAGNILGLIETTDTYTTVQYPDGRKAYIPSEELMSFKNWLASHQPDSNAILRVAETFLGRPYLWGGTSGKGVDCSGFTKSVFYLNGVLLARDASQQVHTGIEIPTDTTWANLEQGDLLFFGTKATPEKKERIKHVAIYMGDGKIIHASGTVKIESLKRSDPDFAEKRFDTFIRAKRILTSLGENGVGLLEKSPFYSRLE